MKISAKYTNIDWIKLGLTDENSDKWQEGICIIEDRFNSRFFDQIEKIQDDEFSGFIIMSIDCLLIETLLQFHLGVKNTETHYKNNQREAFADFFMNSTNFKNDFVSPQICYIFHNHFRNGLLHQAETKNKSLIRIYEEKTIQLFDKNDITKGLIVDRKKFHQKLIIEFQEYIHNLKSNSRNFKNENLRLKAIAKMEFICR